jgi:hypothetical protein
MFIERKVREELNALSKEVFGVASRWQKFIDGVKEPVTKVVTETVPGEKGAPDTTREMTVQVPYGNSKKPQYVIKRYTPEETKELLLKIKKERDEYLAKMKEQQELKKTTERVQELAAGRIE